MGWKVEKRPYSSRKTGTDTEVNGRTHETFLGGL
jgi:hypothetical protein